MKISPLFLLLIIPFFLQGQFEETKFIHTNFSNSIRAIEQGDLDNDGFSDLIFGFTNQLSWSKNLPNEDNWSVNLPIDNTLDEISDVHLEDIDNDGLLDIIVTSERNASISSVSWYQNLGNGDFSDAIVIEEVTESLSSTESISIASGDIDIYGDVDLAVAWALSGVQKIVWYRNLDGAGDFSDPIETTSLVTKPSQLHLVDANADDFLDIVVISDDQAIYWQTNFNGLAFNAAETIVTPSIRLLTYRMGDLDGDNDLDIVAGVAFTDEVVWYENINNNGFFGEAQVLSNEADNVDALEPMDIDGDDDLDIVFIEGFDGEVGYFENTDGQGNFADLFIFSNDIDYSTDSRILPIDFDNDNDLDLLALGSLYDDYFMYTNLDGQGNYGNTQRLNMSPPDVDFFKIGDLDGDTYVDILVETDEPFLLNWMRYNPTYDLFERMRVIPGAIPNNNTLILDLNKDGQNDLAYINNDNANNQLVWQTNLGNGEFAAPMSLQILATGLSQVFSADLNNDGWEDLIVGSRFTTGDIFWYKNLGATSGFADAEVIFTGDEIRTIELGDLDGDGWVDLILLLRNTNDLGWIKNNSGTFASWEFITSTPSSEGVKMHDFNKDGFQDFILTHSTSSNFLAYVQANGPASFDELVLLGNNTVQLENLVLHDYDLDGFTDLLYVDDDMMYWKKYIGGDDIFKVKEEIDVGIDAGLTFQLEDMDNDQDLDLVFGNYRSTYYKANIAANGFIVTKAFYDENNNGDFEIGEPTLLNWEYTLEPDETIYIAITDSLRRFFVSEGDYVLKASGLDGWNSTTGSESCPIEFMSDSIIHKFFGYYPTTLVPSINSELISGPTRCGFTVPFWLTYFNDGTTIEDGLLELYVEDYATFLDATPAPDSIIGDTLFWYFNDLAPTHSANIKLQYEIADENFLGDTIKIFSNTYIRGITNGFEWSNTFEFESEINCAYDPNDKMVRPAGYLDEHYTLFDSPLEYLIRFQNLGTDTAFNIRVLDQLDPDLDISSFRVISSSHEMNVEINPITKVVNYYFENILLPDSTTNEAASHGFIKYVIDPQDNLAEGTVIENTANIFFDFNSPVITNTTWNTLVSSFPLTTQSVTLDPLCYGEASGTISLDVIGFGPLSYDWSVPELSGISNANLFAGDYELTITDGNGSISVEKFTLTDPPALGASLSMEQEDEFNLGAATIMPLGGTPPYTIIWNTVPNQEGEVASDLVAGWYTAEVLDANDCMLIDSIEVTFLTGLTEFPASFNFEVFPNPNQGKVHLQFAQTILEPLEIQILDLNGKEIYANRIANPGSSYSFSMETLSGIYTLGLKWKGQIFYKKLVVIR